MLGALPDLASGLLCGLLFGYVLESAGFGSPCKLTAQFRLSDWSVFKVMFTAIIVAALGLTALEQLGWLAADEVYVPPSYLGAAAIGGALVGAGFAVGGYCPGTSVVGLFSGRLDALVFLLGLLLGTVGFAGTFDTLEAWTTAGETQAVTLPEALHLNPWWVNAALVAAGVAVFWIGARFERRRGGPVTAEQAVAGASADVSAP
ncbi:transporter [Ideonella dechloratans]|uniref:Transporter n=1 Tax=Ideonella dechloratans TaxID=36863 RepID=A0A643F804_IDEDE|nr:DUF6691 family protein [Ideonella dechloratans]KAB0576392.1 transporter [Ideonella dechloratans]UFU10896.1 YeeE/YedE family protein [Ideonella dechloratans]